MTLRYRVFVGTISLLMVSGFQAVSLADEWPTGASDYRIHVVGQGHLDAVWLWPWYESLSEELTAPIPIIHQGIHSGSRSQADSFLSVDASNIVVSAVKQAETNGDLILRCFETEGRETEATLDLRFLKRKWTGIFRSLEIKTLRIHCQTGTIREVNALEE